MTAAPMRSTPPTRDGAEVVEPTPLRESLLAHSRASRAADLARSASAIEVAAAALQQGTDTAGEADRRVLAAGPGPVEAVSVLVRNAARASAGPTHRAVGLDEVIALIGLATAQRGSGAGSVEEAVGTGLALGDELSALLGPRSTDALGEVGPLAGAATAALVLGLPAPLVTEAVAVASSMTVALGVGQPAGLRHHLVGVIAGNAVLAALLAGAGVDGARTALEGRRGWAHVLTGATPQVPEGTA